MAKETSVVDIASGEGPAEEGEAGGLFVKDKHVFRAPAPRGSLLGKHVNKIRRWFSGSDCLLQELNVVHRKGLFTTKMYPLQVLTSWQC